MMSIPITDQAAIAALELLVRYDVAREHSVVIILDNAFRVTATRRDVGLVTIKRDWVDK